MLLPMLTALKILTFLSLISCATFLHAQGNSSSPSVPGNNGISVGAPKSFDNRSLSLMVESLSENLRTMNLIDSKSVAASFGLLQGSQVSEVSRALTVVSRPIPGQTITDKPSATDPSRREVSTSSTVPQRDPAIPWSFDAVANPTGFSPSYGNSPGDLLNDQVNVMYQIFNLRMLQERALSDRIHEKEPRLQSVLGFNVSLDPPRDAENSAAIVEVIVKMKTPAAAQPPAAGKVSLVAMMPQEKTYNRSALSNRANAFGASAVMRLFTVGYTERRRGQTFYVFRDHDTVAFERMRQASDPSLHFGWQFRPVLGKKAVTPGMRQMFAVVSLPSNDLASAADAELEVKVITRWVKYYPGKQTTAERSNILWTSELAQFLSANTANTIPPPAEVVVSDYTVPVFTTNTYQKALSPVVQSVDWAFTGEKTMALMVRGKNFYTGTSLVVGDRTFADPATGLLLKSSESLDATGDTTNLALGEGVLFGRYGSAVPLVPEKLPQDHAIEISSFVVSPAVENLQEVEIGIGASDGACFRDIVPRSQSGQMLEPIVRMQGKIVPRPYSYSWDENDRNLKITVRVPLAGAERVTGVFDVLYPFRGPAFRASWRIVDNPFRLTLLDKQDDPVLASSTGPAAGPPQSTSTTTPIASAAASPAGDKPLAKPQVRSYLIEKLDGTFSVQFFKQGMEEAKKLLNSTIASEKAEGQLKLAELKRKSCWFALLRDGTEAVLSTKLPEVCNDPASPFVRLNGTEASIRLTDALRPTSLILPLRNPYGGIEYLKLPKDAPEPADPKIDEKQVETINANDAVWISVKGSGLSGVVSAFAGESQLETKVDDKGKSLEFFLPGKLTTTAANLDITYRDATGKYLGRTRVIVKCDECILKSKKEDK